MTVRVSKSFWFCAGHRLQNHESKCRHLHGHNWRVTVSLSSAGELDECGRVVDFSVIKDLVKGWVDSKLDHGMILHSDDKAAVDAVKALNGQKLYLMGEPPTAENIAAEIWGATHGLLAEWLKTGVVSIDRVSVEETEGSVATCIG